MRYLPMVGLYQRPAGVGKLVSGVSYVTQPTELTYNALATENGRGYRFTRISGTCTVGSFLYWTGTNMQYVCKSGTGGVIPAGVAMHSPTASGEWAWIQFYGINTSIQATSTFSIASPSVQLFVDGGSAAINQSAAVSGALIGSAGVGVYVSVGQALTQITGSQGLGFLTLL